METPAQQLNIPINVTLSLQEVKCLSFNLTEYGTSNKRQISFEGYEFSFTINFNLIEPTKQAKVSMLCKLIEKQSETVKYELAELKAEGVFLLQNYSDIILRDNTKKNILIPNPLIELCNGIIVSSVRGMFSIKLENTLYSNAILPLLNPSQLIPKHKAVVE